MQLHTRNHVQHLEGAGQVELGESGIEQHADVEGHTERVPDWVLQDCQRSSILCQMARTILVAFDGAQGLDVRNRTVGYELGPLLFVPCRK
jgi:hypothetical protein